MKKIMLMAVVLCFSTGAWSQGKNPGMGGDDADIESLTERVLKLEKKADAFQVYFNYSAAFQESYERKEWGSAFRNRDARFEIKGNITPKLSYRFRHRLNKSNAAKGEDNFAKATDLLFVGYQFNEKIGVQAGKVCQNFGGFEYDENPMFIYQYSDMLNYMDIFMAGVNLSYRPLATQELNLNVTNTYNGKFSEEYGDAPLTLANAGAVKEVEASKHPLTYIFLWNGSFLNDRLQTRWSWGIQTQARHKYSRLLMLGQRLNLPRLQFYMDYYAASDGLDCLRIASTEAADYLSASGAGYFSDVHYDALVAKANWQFAPQWNLMLKGMYETASVEKIEQFKNYRKAWGYLASVEYYPVKRQNFRLFAAYIGRKYNYTSQCTLEDYDTHRVELGFMYRIKAF
ncbi:porin [Prevotella sp. KH2C16]|uniref:porin n=1 Tax=Prevotella sp. KH2C16 TaxID=1855325 RepID=UPI000B81BD88|nr:porin [Prevotella sp. KH2C16]